MTTTLPRVTEEELLQSVAQLARSLGWRVAHFRPSRTAGGWRTAVQFDGKGFPDLLLVRADRVIFAELKSATGRLSAEQVAWLAALEEVAGAVPYNVTSVLWTPAEWFDLTIDKELRRP